MSDFDYDLLVIGGGSGGVRAGRMSAQMGARVAVAEESRWGGTCVIRGCVPKKLFVYASSFPEQFEMARGFGWSVGEARFDWDALRDAKNREISRLETLYSGNLQKAGATLLPQRATVTGPHEARLADGTEVSAKHILIAVGGRPVRPGIPGAELGVISDDIFDLPALPKRAVVVGGGYIGCEFAGILNGLGVETVQLYRREQILRGFDREVRDHVAGAMRARGVDIRVNADPARLDKAGDAIRVSLQDGSSVETDLVLWATGRAPYTADLGLREIGVALAENGAIRVDAYSQTSVPSIYAVGDVTDRVQLTPVAIREGAAFAETVFGGRPVTADHDLIPTAVFTQPEIGTVGLSEEQARETGEIEVYAASFRPMVATLGGGDEKMLMKLVVAKDSRKVLGVHIIGHAAGEMIQLAGVALKMDATKEDFDRTMAVHPTAAEELVTMRTPVR